MFKGKSFNLDKNGFDYRSNKEEKWDKKLNNIFGLVFIIFCILLFLAIINANILNYVVKGEDHTSNVSTKYVFDSSKLGKADRQECSIDATRCNILCNTVEEDLITPSIRRLVQENSCNIINKLEIDGCIFKDNRMKFGWFNVTINVTELEIKRGMYEIEENSFNVPAFKLTSNFKIYSLTMTRLVNGTFNGLNSVATFSMTKLQLESIAYDIFYPMRFSLSSLEIQDIINPIHLKNLTGASVLSKLEILDLRQNTFVDNTIQHDTFSGLSRVQSIYMSKSAITTLNRNAFYEIRSIVKLIDLRDNRLTTVPSDVFTAVLNRCNTSTTCGVKIELENNPWYCDCRLLNLQQMMQLHPTRFPRNPYCTLPSFLQDVPITDVSDLCAANNETTIPIETTTPSEGNVTIPMEPEEKLVTINCQDMKIKTQKSSKQLSSSEPLSFRSNERKFQIIDVKPGTVNIEVTTACDDFVLVWFDKTADVRNQTDIQSSNDVNCLINFGKNITVSNLLIDNTYTFCLCNKSETTVSPFNCLSYYAKSGKGKTEAWLYEDVKLMTITLIIAALVGCVFCGAGFLYILAKRKPSMILDRRQLNHLNNSMNNRSNNSNGNFFQNRGPNAINFSPNLANGMEESHYMDGDELKGRIPYRRTHSEASISSGQSYVSAIVPSLKYNNKNRKSECNNEMKPSTIYMEKYPSEPPPLPPPNRRSEQSTSSNEPLCNVNMLIEPYGYTKSFV